MSAIYHVLNLGAGVQSTALYLMFAEGRVGGIRLDAAIFADTQDEPSEVYRHLEWLESLGGPKIIRTTIGKLSDSLIHGVNSTNQPWISIPAFTPSPDGLETSKLRRQCSKEYKIIPIQRSIRREVLRLQPGARVARGIVVHQYLGISLDESGRAARISKAPRAKYLKVHFPLIEMFMARMHCEEFLRTRVPHEVPKSACRYCPFHDDLAWARFKAQPEEWAEIVKVDTALRSQEVLGNRNRKNKQPMFLHRSLVPISEVVLNAPSPPPVQQWIGFARECTGACGV